MDGELRKLIEHLVGLLVCTAQEATEGGAEKRRLRQDLYKKIFSPSHISRRPPYAKRPRILSLRGLVHFEVNKPLVSPNAKEVAWGIIYRRSLVIEMKCKFFPRCEYDALPRDLKESEYIPPKGDTIKAFLESRPSDVAFFNIIYRYANIHTIEGSRIIIDDYARPDGTTWGEMRCARNLSVEHVHRDLRPPSVSDIFGLEKARLVELSDALEVLAIHQNTEVALGPSGLGALWGKLGHPKPVNGEQGGNSSVDLAQKLLGSDLWISHVDTLKGIHCYFPAIRCDGNLSDIYMRK